MTKKGNGSGRVAQATAALTKATAALKAATEAVRKNREEREQHADEIGRLTAALGKEYEGKSADETAIAILRLQARRKHLDETLPSLAAAVTAAQAVTVTATQEAALLREAGRKDRTAQINAESTQAWRHLLGLRREARRLQNENAADLRTVGLEGSNTLGRWLLDTRADLMCSEAFEIRASVDEVRRLGLPGGPTPVPASV